MGDVVVCECGVVMRDSNGVPGLQCGQNYAYITNTHSHTQTQKKKMLRTHNFI